MNGCVEKAMVTLALLLAACSRTPPAAAPPQPVTLETGSDGDTSIVVNRQAFSPRDTSLVAAVALSIASANAGTEVRLDPRRLPPEHDAAEALPTRTDMRSDPDAGVAKVGSLLEVTIREPDRRRVAASCAGRSPCPERTVLQLVIGTPRLGIPRLPRMAAPLEPRPTYWSVRVVSTILRSGDRGTSTEVSDYVFDKTSTGWSFVREVALMSID